MASNGFFRKIFSPLIWGNLLVMFLLIVLLAVAAWFAMAIYTRHGESVNVPNVTNMIFDDARYALENAGLKAVVVDSSYNRNLPAGSVLDQIPASGNKVKEGREIYLTLNQGQTPTLMIPDIADNSSLREAESSLKALGFKLGPIEYVEGDKDWVLAVKCRGQYVVAGDRVPIDAPIVLVVGNNEIEGYGVEEGEDVESVTLESDEDIPEMDNLTNE